MYRLNIPRYVHVQTEHTLRYMHVPNRAHNRPALTASAALNVRTYLLALNVVGPHFTNPYLYHTLFGDDYILINFVTFQIK